MSRYYSEDLRASYSDADILTPWGDSVKSTGLINRGFFNSHDDILVYGNFAENQNVPGLNLPELFKEEDSIFREHFERLQGLLRDQPSSVDFFKKLGLDSNDFLFEDDDGNIYVIYKELERIADKFSSFQISECFGPEVLIDMWPLVLDLAPDSDNPHKQYDRESVRAEVWTKPISQIEVGDWVVSNDKNGNLVPGYVRRTMTNEVKVLLNFFGTSVTPGHVYYRPDSKLANKYETLIDVLRDDGMIESADGVKLRAATYAPVGGPLDAFVQAVTGARKADGTLEGYKDQGRIRLGTRFLVGDGTERKSFSVADLIEAMGGIIGDDELIRIGEGPGMPLHWDFADTLPKPEDFVLACSGTTLEEIYLAGDWESQGPRLPAPPRLDRGPVEVLKDIDLLAMPRNEPLDVAFEGLPAPKPERMLNRKQRRVAKARKRIAG